MMKITVEMIPNESVSSDLTKHWQHKCITDMEQTKIYCDPL